MKNKGIWYAVGAYFIWGLFPIYWKQLHNVPALQLLGHRIVWSFLLLIGVVFVTRQWQSFRTESGNRRVLGVYSIAALLIGVNWLTYVWAVNAGYIVETSLGYFVNPLLSVLLGVIFLRERLRPLQWLPVILAALGVAYLTAIYGRLPWIALTLAFTFGLYGLVKKIAPLGSLYGLTLETGILFLLALMYLIFIGVTGAGAFLNDGIRTDVLLIGAGVVTAVPLLLFASAAKRIPLTMIGIIQFIAPTIQFMLGVLVYKEPFNHEQLIGYSIVWLALIIFWLEGFYASRMTSPEPIPEMGEG
jgi:chloramphenicol-sensitive protein RarD